MKKLYVFFLLAALVLSSQMVIGQTSTSTKELFFGTFKYDGFANITKGHHWPDRPESKEVYEGRTPAGVKVITLQSDYFVRFISSEHNANDDNYIIFPKGEKIYEKDGKVYAAICGNEIEFYMAINMFRVVQDTIIAKYPELIKNFPSTAVAKVEVHTNDSTTTVTATATATSGSDSSAIATATVSVVINNLGKTDLNQSIKDLSKKAPTDSTTWWHDHKKAVLWTAAGIAVTSAILIADDNDWWRNKTLDLRTMPPGLGDKEVEQKPGIDSDPRSMPSGLGMDTNHRFDFSTISGQKMYGISIKIPIVKLRFH